TSAANGFIDNNGAAASTALAYKRGAVFGLKRYATRLMFGAIPFANSSHLLAIDGSKFVKPVRLPPGRARLCTTPAVTGSLTCTKPGGAVGVVSLTTAATGVEWARITSERKSSSSLANWRARATPPPLQR